jgi:glycosyltransferase involved in cell wall biosynthesis
MIKDGNSPLVSVIVPTKNSSSTLSACLSSIISQTYKNIELIVVDNYSADTTRTIAMEYTKKVFTIGPERGVQINFGVKKALGKYIYRVDSDFVLDSDLIMEAVNAAESNNYGAVIIHNTSDESVSFWSWLRKMERDMYVLDESKVAARFIRKDVFTSIGGFDPLLVFGEDYDLHNRVIKEYKVGRIKAKEVHIGEYKTLKEVAQKHYYYGKTMIYFLKKNRRQGLRQVTPFRRFYLPFFRHPVLGACFLAYQTVRYFSSICGIVVCLLDILRNRLLNIYHGQSSNKVITESTRPDVRHGLMDLVSVIIPTKNSGRTIGKCLASLKNQTYGNIEIIVIDNFSSDATAKIISQFDDVNFSVLEGERTKAKNFGILKSQGEFLLFLDSDMVLQPQVIHDCIKVCLGDSSVAGVVIPEHSIGDGFWVRVRDYERSLYAGSEIESARFFRKKFVTLVGGFDEDIVNYEEATLPFRIRGIGMKVNARINSYIFHNEEGFKIGSWLRKKQYYSGTAELYLKKYMELASSQLSVSYRFKTFVGNGNWKRLINHPVLSVGLFVLKSLEFFAYLRYYKSYILLITRGQVKSDYSS